MSIRDVNVGWERSKLDMVERAQKLIRSGHFEPINPDMDFDARAHFHKIHIKVFEAVAEYVINEPRLKYWSFEDFEAELGNIMAVCCVWAWALDNAASFDDLMVAWNRDVNEEIDASLEYYKREEALAAE
jgi:hypothetical protein